MRALAFSLLPILASSHLDGVYVDRHTSTWRDAANRTLLFHGTNFVKKDAPFFPAVADADIKLMNRMGMTVARLGVMMPGLFPVGPSPDQAYLTATKSIIDRFWAAGIATIIDLHQDVLGPQICGEGTPNWMLNVSSLDSLPFPMPLELHGIPADPASGTFPNKSCSAVGLLKFIGWSEFYMTDACGKAFDQIYHGKGNYSPGAPPLSYMFDRYWSVVAAYFKGHPGVLAYELLNEPWFGDYVKQPSLLLEVGVAEREAVGPYMERMHAVVRKEDSDTPTLFSPAELNNRFMRRVGYEEGFLSGEPMAFHVYCFTGTDGDGPTTAFTKELCHFNDGFTLSQRSSDLRRLRTAGFVTEFGAVSASATGLAEVDFVLDHLDAVQPPLSWAFWSDVPMNETYRMALSRPYAKAVAGETLHAQYDAAKRTFTMSFVPAASMHTTALGGLTEIHISPLVYYDGPPAVSFVPVGCCTVDTSDGIASVRVTRRGTAQVTLTVKPASRLMNPDP